VREPLIAAGTVALCAGVVLAHSAPVQIALGILLVLLVVPCALIDLQRRVIPNRLTGPAAVLAVLVGSVLDPSGEAGRLIAGVAAGAFLLVPALIRPGGMGMGDVKLAGVMGLCLGSAVAPALIVALVTGVLAGGVMIACHGTKDARKTAIPFGPFLAFGALVAIFVGPALVHAYTSSLH
jgi:leader peptidase (prepilin peptidase) / N-methyltransferase